MFVSLTRDPGKVEFPIYAIRGIEKYAEEGNGLGEKARERERERESARESMVEFMDCEASLHKYTKTLLSLTSDWTLVRKNICPNKWKQKRNGMATKKVYLRQGYRDRFNRKTS